MKRLLKVLALVAIFLVLYSIADIVRGVTNLTGWSPPFVIYVVVPLVVFPVLFLFFLRQNMRELAKFEVRPLAGDVSAAFRARVTELEGLGFSSLGPPVTSTVGRLALRAQPMLASDQLSYAAVYELGTSSEVIFDFDSKLEDGRFVMTNSSRLAARGPVRADVIVQAFPNASPAELLKRHQDGVAFLGSRPVSLNGRSDDYWALCRECSQRRFEKLTLVEAFQMLGRQQQHLTPISSRPRS
ncbi:MAG: hypothetical protein JNK82_26345 [Myxococcaceae bacterium]|nr:hypothetical protein [Myxococcaceae bacterium]